MVFRVIQCKNSPMTVRKRWKITRENRLQAKKASVSIRCKLDKPAQKPSDSKWDLISPACHFLGWSMYGPTSTIEGRDTLMMEPVKCDQMSFRHLITYCRIAYDTIIRPIAFRIICLRKKYLRLV